jgi:hypothetical protein
MAPKNHNWLYKLFNDLFEVTLFFDSDTGTPTRETYMMTHVSKITDTYLKGIDESGFKIEFKSVKPFDYKIRKLY